MIQKPYRPIEGYGFSCQMCGNLTWVHADSPEEATALWLGDEGGLTLGCGYMCYDCSVNELEMEP